MTVTTALYRRYRPDSFADVIGQEHVTEPLMTALRKNRVNHAYLFSGPRGCGKTTSARILARCLNCAEGPTDTPCGKCPSCVELARGGSGSLDVIEIDAASHGGVDDARDLRERATYAPVRDRYKIFIIDEAHMVTSAGFNALLKIVEEPPEHIKFIFATTEPDKVIGTIRSRTHHYPFRLVPPEPLMAYLELLCTQENVAVAPGVLSLVIRAGGGSVRDSLSVLDQLMAGAGPNGLDYELAVALLGYTHASLLDDVVEAVAASDAATVFRAVDRVIQTGHDPRRFVEDLLERFRDLIIVQALPESAQSILRGMPTDQIARLQIQAHNLGAAELSRAADVTNTALTEMTGATSPRLHLELLCARILLPSSEQTERGIAARIDRVERRLNYAGNDVGAPVPVSAAATAGNPPLNASAVPAPAGNPPLNASAVPAPAGNPPLNASAVPAPAVQTANPPANPAAAAPVVPETVVPAPVDSAPVVPAPVDSAPVVSAPAVPAVAAPARESLTPPRVSTGDWPVDESAPVTNGTNGRTPAPQEITPARPAPAATPSPVAASSGPGSAASVPPAPAPRPQNPSASPAPSAVPATAHAAGTGPDVEVLRRAWPEILQTLTKIKRSTWALVEPNAQVGHFEDHVLTLAFTTSGLAGAFGRADHSENLRQAIHKTIGIDCQIHAVASGTNSPASSEPNPKAPASRDVPAASTDADWGLPPARMQPAQSEAARTGQAHAQPASTQPVQAAHGPAAVPAASARPDSEAPKPAPSPEPEPEPEPAKSAAGQEAPPASAAAAAEPQATVLDAAGSYAYPDDDWGPPRDEDAPPLDEEPPMDWDPSAPVAARAVQPPAATAASRTESPAPPRSGAEAKTPETIIPAPQAAETVDDPWSRALEQAPGVWTIGSDSNIGNYPPEAPAAAAASPEPEPPHYEPAAAQIPQYAATVPASAEYEVAATDERGEAAVLVPAGARSVPGPDSAAPVMRSSAPVAAPAPAAAQALVPPDATSRQSLYQRLSNSPEAEAGRAKAPARAAATTTYVQDIPSADDETIEESGIFGRAAVERILGGKLVEERSLDGSPLPPRF
ncbi:MULTISPECIES: DNA polymerase III subunit gamma and tau [unclassified Arthrobacter]|uniref:DNA polymerase III subunit gamma and tau n=1 Tax=unclassified Arthrobacter TaxID=235627 RepID=UPI002E04F480|nr:MULTISPECIES: DNA polymerase III subunit gamma and tau [unclassified Arthrobacter]MEC5192753.1 DNA polymerase-3 subunit gamma/tau [Arthrobacter sp. MP_M4]MEC5204236.1 DNA polymerase-3 subunit gamma/tau [Arthrobacter sp. MP_M7]